MTIRGSRGVLLTMGADGTGRSGINARTWVAPNAIGGGYPQPGSGALFRLTRSLTRGLEPLGLAGTRRGTVLTAFAILAYLAVFLADVLSPGAITIGSLSYVVVLVTAWTLSGRTTVVLTIVAIGLRLLASLLGELAPVTALAQAAGIPVIAFVAYTGARNILVARRSREATQEVAELHFLLKTTQTLLANLDLDTIIGDAVRATAMLIARGGAGGTARAAFHRLEGNRLRIVDDLDGRGPTYRHSDYPLEWNCAAVTAIESGRVATVTQQDLSPELQELARQGGWSGGALAPVRAGDHVHGLLVATLRDRSAFTVGELHLLEVIAYTAGLAIGNAQLLSRQREQTDAVAALDEAKSEFLRLASHELRAPLTVISGYLSLLAEGALGVVNPQAAKALALVNTKAREMRQLLDQLLDAARIEDSSLFLKKEPVDLRELVAQAAADASPPGEERDVEVTVPDKPVVVTVDPERIRTIVGNLVGNALKYSPGGQPVRVRVEAGERVMVHVADAGIGIAAEDTPRLFTRFGRVARGDDSRIPGTGLGLYLSRELARLHGGEIEVASTPGQGSTFTLELPREA